MELIASRRTRGATLSSHRDLGADLRRRIDFAAAGIVMDLSGQGVTGLISHVSFDMHPVVWLQTATDAQRDSLPLVGCQDVVARRLADQGVPPAASARVYAQSYETVDGDFAGDWNRATF